MDTDNFLADLLDSTSNVSSRTDTASFVEDRRTVFRYFDTCLDEANQSRSEVRVMLIRSLQAKLVFN